VILGVITSIVVLMV